MIIELELNKKELEMLESFFGFQTQIDTEYIIDKYDLQMCPNAMNSAISTLYRKILEEFEKNKEVI